MKFGIPSSVKNAQAQKDETAAVPVSELLEDASAEPAAAPAVEDRPVKAAPAPKPAAKKEPAPAPAVQVPAEEAPAKEAAASVPAESAPKAEVQKPEPVQDKPAKPRKRIAAASWQGYLEEVRDNLTAELESGMSAEAVMNELRAIRDIQIAASRRAANLAIAALKTASDAQDKINAVLAALKCDTRQ